MTRDAVRPGRGVPRDPAGRVSTHLPWLVGLGVAALAATRFLTLARDPWEWDEVLFTSAAGEGIDVRINHPHPPGYPVYALLARLLALAGLSPFHSALAVTVVAGLLGPVLLVAVARELGARGDAPLWGALLWALTPSVWLHSVRPLSDAPGAAAFYLAVWLLLRAGREPSHGRLLGAALASAACFGIRPQVGLAVLPAACWCAWRVGRARGGAARVAAIGAAGAVAALLPYVVVVAASGGLDAYLAALKAQMDYVRSFDAPGMPELFGAAFWARWCLDPFGHPAVGASLWVVAAGALAVAPRAAAKAAALFLPLALLSMPTLAVHTAPRYGLGLIALPCLLAALVVGEAGRRWPRPTAVAATVLLGAVALPAVPAIVEVASRTSPAVAAIEALHADPRLRGRPVLIDPALRAHADALLHEPFAELDRLRPVPQAPGGLVLKIDGVPFGLEPLRVFRYRSPLLGTISRGRYLEVGIYDGAGVGGSVVTLSGGDSRLDERGSVHLSAGGDLRVVTGVPTLQVRAATLAGPAGARVELVGIDGLDEAVLPRGAGTIECRARGAFRIHVASGTLVLRRTRLFGSGGQSGTQDDSLPVAVDEPAEGAVVAPPVFVRGWCLLPDGGPVAPAEFWVDGEKVVPRRIVRSPRPDVAAALPGAGDAATAGWRADLDPDALAEGPHVLRVVFAGGGRWRAYAERRFVVRAGAAGGAGPTGRARSGR